MDQAHKSFPEQKLIYFFPLGIQACFMEGIMSPHKLSFCYSLRSLWLLQCCYLGNYKLPIWEAGHSSAILAVWHVFTTVLGTHFNEISWPPEVIKL